MNHDPLPPHFVEAAKEYRAAREQREQGQRRQDHKPREKSEQKPSGLKVTLYAEIETAPRKNWLVQNFLGEGEQSCWYGAPGSRKSGIVLDVGAHIAAGMEWFGRRVLQGGVLIIGAERPMLIMRRLAAFRLHHHLNDLPLAVVSGSIDLRSNHEHAKAIVAECARLAERFVIPTRFVIVETVNRVLAGGDENSSKDMGALVDNLALIQESIGVHVASVHHIPIDGKDRMRGHGSLLAAQDVTVSVKKEGDASTATIVKANDGPEGEEVAFRFKSVELYRDPETDEPTAAPVAVPHDGPIPKAEPNRKLPARYKLALEQLADVIADRGEPAPATFGLPAGIRTVPIEAWHDELVARGVIDRDGANPRRDFQRVKSGLQARHLIAERDALLWLAA